MLLAEKLNGTDVILASKSLRRQSLLKQLGFPFKVRIKETEESYPADLRHKEIPEFLAKKKSDAFKLTENELLITSDTIVWHLNKPMEKPANAAEAEMMLKSLSGKSHEVITAVCLRTINHTKVFSEVTTVYFSELSHEEINHYITTQKPFDKAGSYGIQEWIGAIGVLKINGCFYNVMGLPLHRLNHELVEFLA